MMLATGEQEWSKSGSRGLLLRPSGADESEFAVLAAHRPGGARCRRSPRLSRSAHDAELVAGGSAPPLDHPGGQGDLLECYRLAPVNVAGRRRVDAGISHVLGSALRDLAKLLR